LLRNRIIAIYILFALFFLLNPQGNAQNDRYVIEHISVRDGLSKNEVTSIVRDYEGFLWFGTRGGLNRYDGYDFDKFQPEPGSENIIKNPSIERIYEDSRQYLWIGTKSGGLSLMDLKDRSIKNFSFTKDSTGLNDDRVISFLEDPSGVMWIGTWSGGVNKYNFKSRNFSHYLSNEQIRNFCRTRDGSIWAVGLDGIWKYNKSADKFIAADIPEITQNINPSCIIEDPDNPFLWIGGWGTGLFRYNYNNGEIQEYFGPNSGINTLKNVYTLAFDDKSTLWIGTWGMGLWNFSKTTEKLSELNINRKFQNTVIEENAILDIYPDSNDNIWVGTNRCGIVKISRKEPFHNIDISGNYSNAQEVDQVISIFKDIKGNFFVGTIKGLYWSKDGKNYQKVKGIHDAIPSSESIIIQEIKKLENGKLWIGGSKPLAELRWREGKPVLRQCSELYDNPDLDILKVISILEVNDRIYIGTQQNSLFVFSHNGGKYTLTKHLEAQAGVEGAIPNERISCLYKDSRDRIWMGTYKGLGLLKDTAFIPISKYLKNEDELLCSIINDIHEDSSGNIWVATPCGLNKLSENGEENFTLTYYTTRDGLPENYINGILEDDSHNLWLSTNISITKFDRDRERFTSFYNSDGFHVFNFIEGSRFKGRKGNVYFGGIGGLTRFQPDSVRANLNVPEIAFTSLNIWNKTVKVNQKFNERVLLNKSINQTEKIKLSHRENEFSLEIAAMDLTRPESNHYAYKLEGHNEDWIYMGSRRRISFNNLPPGEYTLYVKGSNNNNIWNESGRTMKIEITPPWWKTWYALLIYIGISLGLVFLIRWIAIKQTRLSSEVEMLKVKNEHQKQIDEMKFRFFTNISHEFRTPLTLIVGPLNELLSNPEAQSLSEGVKHKLKLVRKNALRLKKLVNQLIDFRKAETGNLKLQVSETDIVDFIEEISISFKELARINNIRFNTKHQLSNRMIFMDRDKMEIVVNNLVSNSMKHLGEGGMVTVKLSENVQYLNIHVIDNGPGIPQQELDFIFERFYQIESRQNFGSSGIGLALAKRLVDLHGGMIDIKSEVNKRTEFIVSLLKGKYHFNESQIIREKPLKKEKKPEYQEIPGFNPMRKARSVRNSGKKIMVVEDDREVANYIADILTPLYEVIDAENGKQALNMVIKEQPDLVISDIMMPEMDGFEFCSKLKKNDQCLHIPVILLTAKSASKFEIYGVRAGADDYISKPFDPELLREKIHNLLETRKELQNLYTKRVKIEPTEVEITPYEQKMIQKAIRVIEENLTNPRLNATFLAKQLNLSHSTLYRKIKNATGLSVIAFIKRIKLKRAAQLLADKDKTVTEVAYEVGFNDVKHFRNNFTKEFNQTPGEYQKSLNGAKY